MEIPQIITVLEQRRDAITRAIEALRATAGIEPQAQREQKAKREIHFSREGRAALARAMRKQWAKKRALKRQQAR